MTRRLFVTATDTDAGKTHFTEALIYALVKKQYNVAAFKPISAGCENVDGQLLNEDAQRLHGRANLGQTIENVNPFAFEPPIAPHIAAKEANQTLSLPLLTSAYQRLPLAMSDYVITEGAGGWQLPINETEYLSEFAISESMDIILVVNMKLGCLNHALLTLAAIKATGLNLVGWVANCYQGMSRLEDNIATLTAKVDAPLLAVLPYESNIESLSAKIDLSHL
ncbi:dethiobiotin synthase [Thalassotalea agarivorans]|uniref:ATP-dependent dethiobiotin synthetase BioD n=1 Tax=Thalassotalea agarivorans TaxID=349064 RepID=A0A1I0F3S8_THASX|nr:dethiobiotin synthase [Thalassotalea agarivorans]SET52048.1 dethiobiotin synthetase [Thalassotalea agarivorans]